MSNRQPFTAMPSNLAFKTINRLHSAAITVSRGRIGWTGASMPVLEITTTGRRSGRLRKVLLTAAWQDGERMAVIASAGGNDQHPAWFLNMRDNPSVTVRSADSTRSMTARIVSGEERSEIWNALSNSKHYYAYQSKTDREIPVVVLEPDSTQRSS